MPDSPPGSSFSHAYFDVEENYLTQEDFCFYNDDGAINAATAKADKNTATFVALGDAFRLRMSIQETNSESSTYRYILEYCVNGGSWTAIDSSAPTGIQHNSSTYFADGAATSQLLGATAFQTGEGVETLRATVSTTLSSSGVAKQTEFEWSLRLLPVSCNVGDVIYFRLIAVTTTWTGGTYTGGILTGYTHTPSFTVGSGEFTMPERATVFEATQIGIETVAGTAVAATKRLLAVSFDLDVVSAIKTFRPAGYKAVTVATQGKEYTSGSVEGPLAYNDLVYMANAGLCKVTPTTPANNATWTVNKGSSTFTMTFNSVTSASIASDATASAVQTALEAMSTIGAGNVLVTGTNPNFTVKFVGYLSTTVLVLTITGTAASCTAAATGTATRRWTHKPSYNSPDTLQTFTIERGIIAADTTLAQQAAYASISGLSFSFDKDSASMSGSLFAQMVNDTFQPTMSGVTDVTLVPVDPKTVSVWLGTNLVGTGAPQKLTRCFQLSIGADSRQAPVMTLNEDDTSFSTTVETPLGTPVKLTCEHDANGQAMLVALRAGTMQHMVVEMKSATNVETGFPYRAKFVLPVRWEQPDFADVEGVRCIVLNGTISYSTALAGFFQLEVDCPLIAL